MLKGYVEPTSLRSQQIYRSRSEKSLTEITYDYTFVIMLFSLIVLATEDGTTSQANQKLSVGL